MWGLHAVTFYDEQIGVIRFGNKTIDVEHDRAVNARNICLDRRENIVEQIRMVDLGVKTFGCVSARCRGYNANTVTRVQWRFPFRQNNQRASRLIKFRIHPGRDFFTASQCEAYVNLVTHAVCFERPKNRLSHGIA